MKMSIENNIFKRTKLNKNTLESYGFKRKDNKYYYFQNILDNTFKVEIVIDASGVVNGQIIDLSTNEEYTNYRIQNMTGEFVSKVKESYENILIDIREHCYTMVYFISDQANRIAKFIAEKYQDQPEFMWEKYSGFGIFRNPNNHKWYGLIMNINKKLISSQGGEAEIMNVKLSPEHIAELLPKEGYYEAYHMNKKYWISIILDDTLKDEEIINSIIESHQLTEK